MLQPFPSVLGGKRDQAQHTRSINIHVCCCSLCYLHSLQVVESELHYVRSVNQGALCPTKVILGYKQKSLFQSINLKVTLLHPGLEFIQNLLPERHLLKFDQTSVPVAACADLSAAPQANSQLGSKKARPCAAKICVLLTRQVIKAST